MMKNCIVSTLCCLLLISCVSLGGSGRSPKNKFIGKYTYGTTVNEMAVGYMYLYPLSNKRSYFHLEFNGGPPEYNSRELSGTIDLTKGKEAIYSSSGTKNEGIDCKLYFVLKKDKIQISTDPQHDDCLSIHSISADGVFKCQSIKKPVYYIDRHGDTLYFEKLVKNL